MSKTNSKKLERLRDRVWTQQNSLVLQRYLQGRNIPNGGTVELNELFKEAVLVTLSCDQMTVSPYKLSGIGITTFDRRSLNTEGLIDTSAGPHAENYLSHIWSMHLRLQEHAHLPAGNSNPDAYHFGTSAFASKDEVVDFLTQIWTQPMDEENLELGLRPVICLQHGNMYELAALWQDLGFDPAKIGTTIAMLDGQVIAEQSKLTRNPYAELDYLLAQYKIQPKDSGNCGNAAAYITISSMLSALRKHLYQSPSNPKAKPGKHGQSASKTAQSVVNELMERPTPAPPVGTEVFCIRCVSSDHFFTECPHSDLDGLE
ncbi:uncharacterized protein N0V89_008117 [Didymosphaeria variabile]|uniref:Gfd2/YDR514C-like C-terminal domain-containing protein n=1 Tax=Didymosphaeria variabile TaxID=1932322 RepID=A0A9W8XHH8_9PLEO|nr:uncharacterized protein N0V89_008117 [Didymosphaeria variabile]KAJ4349501.1 hypothetical protein N0V89_008117 [Didymosphaeria variabile]